MTGMEIVALLAIGLAAGFLAGLLGIGGGVLLVPAMVLVLGFDQHTAQGTSLAVIVPAAVLGSWTHHRGGRLVLRDAAALAVGGIAGALVGSFTALSLDEVLLRRLFAALLVLIALRMLIRRAPAPARETAPEAD
ncbi:MAG TPA: sulfite exporter TauE/SafE family protein [Candidatus Limnocylindria bacterium]|nr:sulfite exporter TauE/SafE family protein [Candidatus Limnocylindria bacterium]